MQLAMPRNYVELEQEEMMYLDGGWSASQVAKNASGMIAVASLAWIGKAIHKFAIANKNMGFWSMAGKLGVTAAKALWALPWWAKLATFAAGACVIYAMGTWDIF